jgi:formylglycine-generating enzyme required for sulfatase activity
MTHSGAVGQVINVWEDLESTATSPSNMPAALGMPVGELVSGPDYEVAEITEDMTPEQKINVRLANLRARLLAVAAGVREKESLTLSDPLEDTLGNLLRQLEKDQEPLPNVFVQLSDEEEIPVEGLPLVGPLIDDEVPEWVEIPAGEFWMGNDTGHAREKPLHRLYLDTFWIARTLVTNAQYRLFVEVTGYRSLSHWSVDKIPLGWEQHPVVNIAWDDAIAYCHWLSKIAGQVISLPSEAEWEKAARGHEDEREYPWGDAFDPKRANTKEAGIRQTSPVTRFSYGASPYGVLDMSGNVWEWTRSLWGKDYSNFGYSYPYVLEDGREDLTSPALHVLRGGSWFNEKKQACVYVRSRNAPRHDFDHRWGFRVVVSPFISEI